MTADEPEPDEEVAANEDEEEEPPWPVGFIVLAGLAALYVGWRLIQLVVRGIDWLF